MMISDNILAAFRAGVSSVEEDKLVMNEIANSDSFSELLDLMDEIDAIDGLDELRNEFNESPDAFNDYNEIHNNIK